MLFCLISKKLVEAIPLPPLFLDLLIYLFSVIYLYLPVRWLTE